MIDRDFSRTAARLQRPRATSLQRCHLVACATTTAKQSSLPCYVFLVGKRSETQAVLLPRSSRVGGKRLATQLAGRGQRRRALPRRHAEHRLRRHVERQWERINAHHAATEGSTFDAARLRRRRHGGSSVRGRSTTVASRVVSRVGADARDGYVPRSAVGRLHLRRAEQVAAEPRVADALVADDVDQRGLAGGEARAQRRDDLVGLARRARRGSRSPRTCGRSGCPASMSNGSVRPLSIGICSKLGPHELLFQSTVRIGSW